MLSEDGNEKTDGSSEDKFSEANQYTFSPHSNHAQPSANNIEDEKFGNLLNIKP